jgi:hypothetical protein
MKNVYCYTGGYRKELKGMEQNGLIKLMQFHYENRNKNIKSAAPPSKPTWEEMNYSWNELPKLTWDDLDKTSGKYNRIKDLIGKENARDIKHLDSAYMAQCDAFITSDKDDISSKKNEIYQLLNIRVFHFHVDWENFVSYCNS